MQPPDADTSEQRVAAPPEKDRAELPISSLVATSAAVLGVTGAVLLIVGGIADGLDRITMLSYLVLGALTAGGTLVHDWVTLQRRLAAAPNVPAEVGSVSAVRSTLATGRWPCAVGAAIAPLAIALGDALPLLILGAMFVSGGIARFALAVVIMRWQRTRGRMYFASPPFNGANRRYYYRAI